MDSPPAAAGPAPRAAVAAASAAAWPRGAAAAASAADAAPAAWPAAGVTLVTGGARSGKSRFSLALAAGCRSAAYLATAEPLDEEMRRRIERHRAERGEGWTTIEEAVDLAGALGRLPADAEVAVVDCLTVWLGNLVHRAAAGVAPSSRTGGGDAATGAADPAAVASRGRAAAGDRAAAGGRAAAPAPPGVAAGAAAPLFAGSFGALTPPAAIFEESSRADDDPRARSSSASPDLADPAAFPEIAAFLSRLDDPPCPLVLVTNEVGWGIVPDNPLARAFRDLAGRVNEEVARRAERVVLMVAGRPLELPGGRGG